MKPRNLGLKMDQQSIVHLVFFFIFVLISTCHGRRLDVEEVTKRQLDTLIKTEDYLAVFWCKSLKNKLSA